MFCEKCGTKLREGAAFCPECGIAAGALGSAPLPYEYSYETHDPLFKRQTWVFIFVMFFVFTGLGLWVAIAEGRYFDNMWIVAVVMGVLVPLGVLLVAWLYKGKGKKWGVWRTLYVLTPDGIASGFPPDVSRRLGGGGLALAMVNLAGRQNWGVISHGLNEALNNIPRTIMGLPVWPWGAFSTAEYRPQERKIALHIIESDGRTMTIEANPDNYTVVEQLVRRYMGGRRGES